MSFRDRVRAAQERREQIVKFGACEARSLQGGHQCRLTADGHSEHQCRCEYRWNEES